ncbi:Superoxide dismutase 1 copper chaperone like protein [Verticillium longisporum]|nr:Superoxide dismutase 1 copper chaperone like protein [Verticillium longisporum]
MVQVSPTTTLIDLTVRGVTPGTYQATIRSSGDLHDGAASTGGIWTEGEKEGAPKGELGRFTVDKDGKASAFLNHPFQIWEIIGRAMVVSKQDDAAAPLKNDADTLVGVVARSAGMWDNDKTVYGPTIGMWVSNTDAHIWKTAVKMVAAKKHVPIVKKRRFLLADRP